LVSALALVTVMVTDILIMVMDILIMVMDMEDITHTIHIMAMPIILLLMEGETDPAQCPLPGITIRLLQVRVAEAAHMHHHQEGDPPPSVSQLFLTPGEAHQG
jgi:hypothetical protein